MKTKQEQKEEALEEYWAIRSSERETLEAIVIPATKAFDAIVDAAKGVYLTRIKEIDEQDEPLEVDKE